MILTCQVPFKVVLHDVPDYNERHKLLEGLKNKLEALLSPKLVSAFNSHSLGMVLSSYILEIFLYILYIQDHLICLNC